MSKLSHDLRHTALQEIDRTQRFFTARRRYVLVGVLSLAFVGLSVIEDGGFPGHHDYLEFLKEVGYAGLVALLLIFTVEKYAKERHHDLIEQMGKSILGAVFERALHPKLVDSLEALLLEQRFYRTELEIDFEFEPGDREGKCWMRSVTRFSLNHARKDEVAWFALPATLRGHEDGARSARLDWLEVDHERLDARLASEHGDAYGVRMDDEDGVVEVRLPPNGARPIAFAMSREVDESGFEILTNEWLATELSASIKRSAGFEGEIFVTGAEGRREQSAPPGSKTLHFEKVILPGQAVVVSWWKAVDAVDRARAPSEEAAAAGALPH